MATEMKVTKEALRAAMNAEFCGTRMSDAMMHGAYYDTEVLEAALNAALAEMLIPVSAEKRWTDGRVVGSVWTEIQMEMIEELANYPQIETRILYAIKEQK